MLEEFLFFPLPDRARTATLSSAPLPQRFTARQLRVPWPYLQCQAPLFFKVRVITALCRIFRKAGQTSLVIPLPKDTSSCCLRAAGEEGLTRGRSRVGCGGVHCANPSASPMHPSCSCNAQPVWEEEFRVCSGGTGGSLGDWGNRTGQLLDVSPQGSLASSAVGNRTTDACPRTGYLIKYFST